MSRRSMAAALAPTEGPSRCRELQNSDWASDERRPRCRNCEARGYACQWGLKASFHPNRSLRLSSPDEATLLAIEKARQNAPGDIENGLPQSRLEPSTPIFIDDTDEVIRHYQISRDTSSSSDSEADRDDNHLPTATLPRTENVHHPPDFITYDSVRTDTGPNHTLESEITIESLLSPAQPRRFGEIHEGAGLSQLTTSPGSSILPFSLGQAISRNTSPLPEPSIPVTNVESASLISLYLYETGTWCETTDSEMHFTSKSVHQLLASKSFFASALALASRQRDAAQGHQRSVTLELYQYTIQLLLRQEPGEAGAPVLATCTLLCVYEMMASCVWEWRRHLKGCASLLHTRKWNGSCNDIVKTCFWAFARIDVWAAFISCKKTLIPTDSWVNDSSIQSAAAKGNVDDYCNLAILVFAQIVNLLADAKPDGKGVDIAYSSCVQKLWDELQAWRRLRPKEVCPLLRESSTGSNPFPSVVFSRPSSICGNTFYHTGSILLLQTGYHGTRAHVSDSETVRLSRYLDPVWHARELGGISASNFSHANWVNQLQPLYVAGTVFADQTVVSLCGQTRWASSPGTPRSRQAPLMTMDDAEEYASEKIALLKQLARIERETGWKTSDRASELRGLWGFG
ncbi:putative Zn(II)2Cys6 transcription factor [Aspergillus alliaceus]|uniref:Putative Zn(II)2Cys6 transcription factor n=1 Tax=Petromyces alliaceus TaxID=209559 RepID=A0A5N7CH88_PETAA|nr:putative Zn(II)2Cys6 transcription factor [Aspergillus alliaceus]